MDHRSTHDVHPAWTDGPFTVGAPESTGFDVTADHPSTSEILDGWVHASRHDFYASVGRGPSPIFLSRFQSPLPTMSSATAKI